MNEQRRLALVRRQVRLAKVARREAMAALADATREEAKSSALAERSRALLEGYRLSHGPCGAHLLGDLSRFALALSDVARRSEEARRDAGEQLRWQAETLVAADIRAERQSARLQDATREYSALLELREADHSTPVARKLQSTRRKTDRG